MAIWKVAPSRAALRFKPRSTLVDHLDIRIDEAGDDYLKGSMPVDQRTQQSMGFLHGGASVALAETLGSIAANFCVDPSTHAAVGLQINANHVRTVRSGRVTGTARPVHLGGSTQVWTIAIKDEQGRTVSVATLTMAVIERARMGIER